MYTVKEGGVTTRLPWERHPKKQAGIRGPLGFPLPHPAQQCVFPVTKAMMWPGPCWAKSSL